MIIELDNPLLLPKVIDLAKRIEDFPLGKFRSMVEDGFSRKDTRLIVYQKDEEIKGFIYSTIDFFDGERVAFIQATYIEPKMNGVGKEMLADMRKWAELKDCAYLYMITKRDETRAYERKYKFEQVGTVMRRSVK